MSLERIIRGSDLQVVERQELPGKEAMFSPIPAGLDPRVRKVISETAPGGLY